MKFRKYKVNSEFFRNWNSQMAYILGFTFADGNIYSQTISWKLSNTKANKRLLVKINQTLNSDYPIEEQKDYLRLRINHHLMVKDLNSLGVNPNKSKTAKFPKIPSSCLPHFVRGFLDGDGWITTKKEKMEISVGFSNGSYEFLKELGECFKNQLSVSTFNLRERIRQTKNKKLSKTYMIEYYSDNAYKIIRYLYDNLKEEDLFLSRKYQKQLKAREIYEELKRGSKLWRQTEKKHKTPMKELLHKLYFEDHLDGLKTAEKLNVHFSSIYRWLAKTGIKFPVPKQRRIVTTKCLVCNKKITRYKGRYVKYCSPICRFKARHTGKFVRCIWCGEKVYRPKWWFNINNKVFCSRKCIGKWQRIRLAKNLFQRSKITGQFLPSKSN